MTPSKSKRMSPASDAGQMPPTESNPVRQRYQMGCHGNGGSDIGSRKPTSSRQFNRGSTRGRY